MKTCFMFGHADTPKITQQLCRVLDQCYEEYGIRSFLVGSRGNFDCNEAPAALRYLKNKHHDVEVWRLLAYHPGRNGSELQISDLFNGTYYPEGMEKTPNAYAIVKANQIAVSQSDLIVCYVWHMGNTEKLLRYARRQGIRVINLAPPRDETRL